MQGKITRKVNFDNLINMILINMTYSRVFSNARFPTAAFIDVWTVTNNVRCLEKTGIDVNFADLKNAFMLEWTEKVMKNIFHEWSRAIFGRWFLSNMNLWPKFYVWSLDIK